MEKPRLLVAFQAVAVVLVPAVVVGTFVAVWGAKGVFFFSWNSALGPLCILVSAFCLVTAAWTISWERNKAVERFGDREGGKS